MVKVLIQIKDNKLFFQIRKRLNNEQKNLINTNIISENELVFSDEYIIENSKIVHNFIKELVNSNDLDTLVIKESSLAELVLYICKNIPKLTSLYLLEENILTYKICKRIIETNSIKYVSFYNAPTYLVELLDKKNITVNSRCEILFLSNFMQINKIETFSSLYYKKSIHINFPMSSQDIEDFASFIQINKYLKYIYVNSANKNDIEIILEILYKEKIKNLKIYVQNNIQDIETIEYLKKINAKNKKINNIQFKIHYSDEYIEDNFISQIKLNTIKICVLITLIFISIVILFVFYSNYRSMLKVNDIQKDINSVIADYNENKPIIEDDKINIDNTPEEIQITNYEVASLLTINKDTVGWLKVNETNVNYPVVQAKDNKYYLNKNFKKADDNSGWIFMDYRADMKNMPDNTIIFGHNMYYSGVMFGTLYKTKYSNWYTKKENQIIQFDSLYKKMNWKIFSIYVTDVTNDYLYANFSDEDKHQEFINLITDRSIYEFNTPVSTNDKILTLSTCASNGKKRLVIHAVLLEEN